MITEGILDIKGKGAEIESSTVLDIRAARGHTAHMNVVAVITGSVVMLAQWIQVPGTTDDAATSPAPWSTPEDSSMGIFVWLLGAIVLFAVVHVVRTRMRP